MNWSPQQAEAIERVAAWLSDPHRRPVFSLSGYAGTGKTTLARHIAAQSGRATVYAAPTGKAASVMRAKGCAGASTIHRLIYNPVEVFKRGKDGRGAIDVEFELKADGECHIETAELVIIDECSMVDDRVGNDLLSFGVPVIALGDPAQLPPVNGPGFFGRMPPDLVLTEVHRQARDSPIIDLATRVRSGEALAVGRYGDSSVVARRDLPPDCMMRHDQTIVGRNRTRHKANANARRRMGFDGELPQAGDRLMCVRNCRDLDLWNGETYMVVTAAADDDRFLDLQVETDDGRVIACRAWQCNFRGERPGHHERPRAQEFEFGYALTCHKSQGSQWGDVLVVDESSVFGTDASKWLYTAITRAAQRVCIAV